MAAQRRALRAARRAAHVLTNPEYMRSELLRVGFAPERTTVLPLFTGSHTPDQPRGALPDGLAAFLEEGEGPLLVTSARLVPEKGVDRLLDALAATAPPYRAVVAGTGPAEQELRARVAELGLANRVRLSGFLPSPELEELYARADVVLCPSTWDEPFGLIGLEAMAHAKPVVAFRVGGVPEWLADGETGLLVARGDVEGMARAIERLASDADLRTELGRRGRELLDERFSRAAHVEGLERELLSASRRPPARPRRRGRSLPSL
jgi:glycosyltransferase involved in cell wall biosynthesis